MICYLDRIFCNDYQDCHVGEGCKRALTPAIVRAATFEGLPISQFANTPPCFQTKHWLRTKGKDTK